MDKNERNTKVNRQMALLWMVALLLAPAVAAETCSVPSSSDYISIGSRTFAPSEKTIDVSPTNLTNLHVLIQFYQLPDASQRNTLVGLGVVENNYLPENTWIASVPTSKLQQILALPYVRWIGDIQPEDKIDTRLVNDDVAAWAIDGSGKLRLSIQTFSDKTTNELAAVVAKYGEVKEKINTLNMVTALVSKEKAQELSKEKIIQWITEIPPLLEPVNDGARTATGVNTVQAAPYGLSGNGIDLMVYDAGLVDANHNDLANRTTIGTRDAGQTVIDHSTHVAGTAAGNGSINNLYRGMAPKAKIISYSDSQNFYFGTGDLDADSTEGISLGADLFTASLGSNIAPNRLNCDREGDYNSASQLVDTLINNRISGTFLMVWAAGNERQGAAPCGQYGTIGLPATAKNSIVVGAVEDNGAMSSFSSWGPTDDGRIKPDVVAPGDGIISTLPGNAYGIMSGTSMATPVVSGISTLIYEQYRTNNSGQNPKAATVKALLIHTATDLGNTGPDYQYGYGLVNANSAVDVIRADAKQTQRIKQGNITNSTAGVATVEAYKLNVPVGAAKLKLTLVWSDKPAAASNPSKTLINDLDLIVVDPNNKAYYPWTLDPTNASANAVQTRTDHTNNVEQVEVNNPTAGAWKVTVVASVLDGMQEFSLVSSHPLNANMIMAKVRNIGTAQASNIRVDFYEGNPDSGGTLVGTSTINSIDAGSSQNTSTPWVPNGFGNRDVCIKLDAQNAIAELQETNNQACRQVLITQENISNLPVDADKDGYVREKDCDDHNARVHPSAVEDCNARGVDEDCDGLIDEGCAQSDWAPTYWNDIQETSRTYDQVVFKQYFSWNQQNLNKFKSMKANYQYELRRPNEPDAWDYYVNSNNLLGGCHPGYVWSNLPGPTDVFVSEEHNWLWGCALQSWQDEEFEIVAKGTDELKSDYGYFVEVGFKRKTRNARIGIITESEWCGKWGLDSNWLPYCDLGRKFGVFEMSKKTVDS